MRPREIIRQTIQCPKDSAGPMRSRLSRRAKSNTATTASPEARSVPMPTPLARRQTGSPLCFLRLLSNADSGTKRRNMLIRRAIFPAA